MWTPSASARLFAELARERSDDAVDQVPMAVRWAEDAPAPERGVKRPRDWASPPRERACLPAPPGVSQEQPPLLTRQLTTGTPPVSPPGSPLVPRRSMSVLRNPIWEAMFEMAEQEDVWRTETGARRYGPWEEDPDEYDLAALVPELTAPPLLVRQNAVAREYVQPEMDVE